MTAELKKLYENAAYTWFTHIQTCNHFIKKTDDKAWWEARKVECMINYNFCMLRSSEPENNVKEITTQEFTERFGGMTPQELINQLN